MSEGKGGLGHRVGHCSRLFLCSGRGLRQLSLALPQPPSPAEDTRYSPGGLLGLDLQEITCTLQIQADAEVSELAALLPFRRESDS